jgi:hypothetical protein
MFTNKELVHASTPSGDSRARASLIIALGPIAESAVPALRIRLYNDETAWVAAMCLNEIRTESAVSALEEAARSSSGGRDAYSCR